MAIFRQYIAPLLIVVVFLIALLAVSFRIFSPDDMAIPAPVGEISPQMVQAYIPNKVSSLPPSLSALVNGMTEDQAF